MEPFFTASTAWPRTIRFSGRFPIIHTGRTIGHAEISLSLETYRQEMVWLRNTALMVLAVSLVVIVIATGIILRVLMRKPLDILRDGMDRIARGEGDYRFDKIHHEELADIARRFETMADKIRQRERSLKKEVAERKRAEEKIRQSDIRTRANPQRHSRYSVSARSRRTVFGYARESGAPGGFSGPLHRAENRTGHAAKVGPHFPQATLPILRNR